MNEHVLNKLQFDVVRTLLATRCKGSAGRKLAERIRPSRSPKQVQLWMDQVRELLDESQNIGLPPLGSVRDIREFVVASARPAGLEADELGEIADALSATSGVRQWAGELSDRAVLLRALTERVGDLDPIAAKIRDAIDSRHCVVDQASAKLSSVRATIRKAKDQIAIVFKRLLRQTSLTRYLQYANTTIHNDRSVVPLKAEHRGRIAGIVHRSSDSGATLFVEPTEAVELNNSIVRLRQEEHKEICRILGELSRLVHVNADEIIKTINTIAVLDLLTAKVCFARDFNALIPALSEDRSLALYDARHPVLESMVSVDRREAPSKASGDGHDSSESAERVEAIVPITVRLGDDFDLLVITGPNTGGKTVALKTVGLIALMHQAGIPIPVSPGSTMPVYKDIFIDIGDEQSIEQSLSTFSAHLATVLNILDHAGPKSLVLIDELGSGTDPDEGAAIGRAVMEELLSRKASIMVTTHLSALKAVAFTQDRVDNASVDFDIQTLKPLYRLLIGEPGNSHALVIAKRLGMSQLMVDRARSHLSGQQQALKKAIAGTLASRRDAERARDRALQATLKAEQHQQELLRQTNALSAAREHHERWVRWVSELSPGDSVFVKSFDRPGHVVRMQLHQQTAIISAGAIDIEVSLTQLQPPEDTAA